MTMTTKASTTTRHGLRLQILAHHQFYQQPQPRAHQKDNHQRNLLNTRIVYSNTNTMYANTRRRKQSTRNTKQYLRRYLTWLQLTPINTLYQRTTTALMGFVLLILSYSFTSYERTMELYYRNNYKRIGFYWMHNGNLLLPYQYYSLAFKTANYFLKLEKSHSWSKRSFAMHTFPSKTLDFSTCHVIHI